MYSILLADDEVIFLEFLENVIHWNEYNCKIVKAVSNGQDAADYISTHHVDIAFIDITMPIMDGIAVCQALKENGSETRFIITTAHNEFKYAYQAIKIGINDYLLKPFSADELVEVLRRAISSFSETSKTLSSVDLIDEGTSKYEIIARQVDDYLLENFSNSSLNLSCISYDLCFESNYLRRVYKITFGKTIMQRLEEIRIEKAKALLLSGRYQVQRIAELVGFSDQFYFSKRFKLATGMTSTEYVKAHTRVCKNFCK